MSQHRRLLTCAVTVLALLVGASSALARTHATHSTRISGVVVSINAKRHTLKLRVGRTAKQRRATARAASAGGSSTIVVAFGDASVTGPDGAVSVGDDVTVTTDGPASQTTVAASIDVVGQSNGGDAGRGAAVPGEVTAVGPTDGTLTLAVTSTDAQGQSQDSSVIVTVGPSTILAVGDTNGDGKITLADISVGDHVLVFTDDATANPMAVLGILDSSQPGGDHQGGDPPSTTPTPIPGTVTGVDPSALTMSVNVTSGPLAGHTIVVGTTSKTSFGGTSAAAGPFGLADVNVNDSVVVYTPDATTTPIVAVGVVDQTTPSASPSTAPAYDTFNGTVAGIAGNSLQVAVSGGGPLGGQTVTVDVDSSTRYKGTTTDGTAFTLGDVHVGDQVRVYTTSLDPQPLLAVFVGDGPSSSSSSGGSGGSSGDSGGSGGSTPPASPASTPAEPQRFGGVVTAVRSDGLTVTVVSGGALNGQSVIVSVPSTASFQDDPETGAGTSLATISVGDAVEIHTDSETGSPIVAVGVTDDGVYTGG